MGDELRIDWLPDRRTPLWHLEQPLRQKTTPYFVRVPLLVVIHCGSFNWPASDVCLLAHAGRAGNRTCIQSFTALYRRNGPGPAEGQAGRSQSTDPGHRNTPGPGCELVDCETRARQCDCQLHSSIMEWPDRLALDVRSDGHSFCPILHCHAVCPGEPSLAGSEWPD